MAQYNNLPQQYFNNLHQVPALNQQYVQPQQPYITQNQPQPQSQILMENIIPNQQQQQLQKPSLNQIKCIPELNERYNDYSKTKQETEDLRFKTVKYDKNYESSVMEKMYDLEQLIDKFTGDDALIKKYNHADMTDVDLFVNYCLLFKSAVNHYSNVLSVDDGAVWIRYLLFLGPIHQLKCNDVLEMFENHLKTIGMDSRYVLTNHVFKSYDMLSNTIIKTNGVNSMKRKNSDEISTELPEKITTLHQVKKNSKECVVETLESYKYLKYMQIANIFYKVTLPTSMMFNKNYARKEPNMDNNNKQTHSTLTTLTMSKTMIVALSSHTSTQNMFKFILIDAASNEQIKKACEEYIDNIDEFDIDFEVVLGQTKKDFVVYNLNSKRYSEPTPLDNIVISDEVAKGKYYFAAINSVIVRKCKENDKLSLRAYSKFIFSFDMSNNLHDVMKNICEAKSLDELRKLHPSFKKSLNL